MDELLKTLLLTYLFVAISVGICIFSTVKGCIKLVNKIENNKIKYPLCIVICGALIGLWFFYFIYHNVYPLSFAYYECRNGIIEERTGYIEEINRREKDRIEVIIDGKAYMMVYGTRAPNVHITKELVAGDAVQFFYGKHSMYIFSICQQDRG